MAFLERLSRLWSEYERISRMRDAVVEDWNSRDRGGLPIPERLTEIYDKRKMALMGAIVGAHEELDALARVTRPTVMAHNPRDVIRLVGR